MITIYTIANCDGCRHAIALARFKNLPFQVIELKNQQDVDDLHIKLGNKRNITVPLVFHENEYIGGLVEFKRWTSQYLINKGKEYR